MCQGTECKSQQDIDNWLENKYLVVLTNQKRFDPITEDNANRIAKESVVQWYPISSAVSMTYELEVKESMLNLDLRMSLLPSELLPYFEIAEKRAFPFVRSKSTERVPVRMTLDMSLYMGFSSRVLYSVPELIRDIGGFVVFFVIFSGTISFVLNYQKLDNFMVQQLYSHRPKKNPGSTEKLV